MGILRGWWIGNFSIRALALPLASSYSSINRSQNPEQLDKGDLHRSSSQLCESSQLWLNLNSENYLFRFSHLAPLGSQIGFGSTDDEPWTTYHCQSPS